MDIDVAEQLDHLRTLQLQGRGLDWSRPMHRDLSWQRLIHKWGDAELRFALEAATDTAPTATNIRRWAGVCRKLIMHASCAANLLVLRYAMFLRTVS